GDQIMKINGEFTKDMTRVDAVKKMRGPKDTKVTLTLKRENTPEVFDVTMTREIIKIQSVKWKKLEPGYGYVRLTQFQERTDDDLERALKALDKETAGLQGLVLDLRNDPGGLLTQAVRVADLFLESGLIVYPAERPLDPGAGHRPRHRDGPDHPPRQGGKAGRRAAARGEPAAAPRALEGRPRPAGTGQGRRRPGRRAGRERHQRQGRRARLRPAARPLARAAQELAGLQDVRRSPGRLKPAGCSPPRGPASPQCI